jgi:hypothetical protein
MADGPLRDLERLQLSPHDIERRKAFVDFRSDDATRIAAKVRGVDFAAWDSRT